MWFMPDFVNPHAVPPPSPLAHNPGDTTEYHTFMVRGIIAVSVVNECTALQNCMAFILIRATHTWNKICAATIADTLSSAENSTKLNCDFFMDTRGSEDNTAISWWLLINMQWVWPILTACFQHETVPDIVIKTSNNVVCSFRCVLLWTCRYRRLSHEWTWT